MRFEQSLAHEWLQLARDDVIVVDDADINREARENLWVFSPREDQLGRVDSDTMMRLVDEIIRHRRAALSDRGLPEMIFYCWHDPLARQLRFSLVSSLHGRLPFAREAKKVDLWTVVGAVVQDDWLNPSWGEQADASPATRSPDGLQVFAFELAADA
jgi:hypothetical protein